MRVNGRGTRCTAKVRLASAYVGVFGCLYYCVVSNTLCCACFTLSASVPEFAGKLTYANGSSYDVS